MEDGDTVLFFISLLLAGFLWIRWYWAFWSDRLHEVRSNRAYILMQGIPVVCGVVIWYVLTRFAASDVRNDPVYIWLYFVIGLAWISLGEWLCHFLGISPIFDVLERRNSSAFVALTGALVGVTFCYSGGNIGEGPGSYVVLFSAGLATFAFFAIWWIYTLVTEAEYTVTVDRDLAAGFRMSGFLLAAGLILGRAAAGNWVSAEATIADLVTYGSPVLILLIVAIVTERVMRPNIDNPVPSPLWYGLMPLLVYVGGAVIYLALGNFPA